MSYRSVNQQPNPTTEYRKVQRIVLIRIGVLCTEDIAKTLVARGTDG